MFPNKVPSGGSLALLLAALLCAPLAARAGEKVTLRPSLEVEQAWDSNVYNLDDALVYLQIGGSTCGGTATNNQVKCNTEEDSLVTIVRPALTLENAGELGHARLALSAESRTVWIESEMNTLNPSGNFDIERKLTPRFTILGAGSYYELEGHDNVFSHDPSSSPVPLQPLAGAVPDAKRDYIMAGFRYALRPLTDMTLRGSAGRLNFERLNPELNPSFRTCLEEGTCIERAAFLNTGGSQYRDQDMKTATLSFDHRLTPLDRIGLSFDYYGTDYQDLGVGERETSITNGELSWIHEWTQVWSSSISVGARILDTSEKDVPSVGTTTCGFFQFCSERLGTDDTSDTGLGMVGSVSLQGTFARSSISFAYSRDTRSTGGQFATDFDIDTFSVAYVRRLAERVTLRLNGEYSFYDSVSDEIAPYPATGTFVAVPPIGLPEPRYSCPLGGTLGSTAGTFQCFGGSVKEERTFWTAHARIDWQLRKRLTAFGAIHYFKPDSERKFGGGAESTTVDYDKWLLGVGMRYAWDIDL